MNILPQDVLDIIYYYKKKLDFSNVLNELKNIKKKCRNCKFKKICLYKCLTCNKNICYNCRYNDLNDKFVDKNTFELFYKCDSCDIEKYNYDCVEDDYDDTLDCYYEYDNINSMNDIF